MNLVTKRFLILVSVCFVLSFIAYGIFHFNSDKSKYNNETDKPISSNSLEVTKDTPEFLSENSLKGTLYVSVIGDVKFPVANPTVKKNNELGNKIIHFINVQPNELDKIDSKSRFIIVDSKLLSSDSGKLHKEIFHWLKQKRTVLLYSDNLTNETIQDVFGKEYELYKFDSSFEMKYPIYGLGYSPNEKKVIPLFLVINSEGDELNADIVNFLIRKKDF